MTAAPSAGPRGAVAPVFVGSAIYRGSSYGATHPLRVPRVSTVIDLARALGWLPAARFQNSPRAKPAALRAFHTEPYLTALQRAEAEGTVSDQVRARHRLGTLSNPVFAEMFRRPATGAGGTLWAAETLAHAPAGVVHVPGGGTHHGLPDRANGFCYLNDVVLGIKALLGAGLTRVAYVDLDAHHCDGVEAAFTGDPRVRMISVHEQGRWPFSGGLTDTAGGSGFFLPVPRGYNDTEARAVLHGLILPRVAAFAPQALVVQCGADSLTEDPLSRLCLSNRAYLEALAELRPLSPRLIVLGGGGYNPWSVGRLWTAIWGWLSGQELPDRLPEPARAVLAGLSWSGGARPPPGPHLLDTLLDPPREGPVRPEITAALAVLARRPEGA
ncbi:acetoin utilization protein AcuC [Pseudogemmobacter blasticus]|uniref:Acetoin utilization protein AcuC n=1 Tax=Fuscovulum blasticum DSM 2131 TaxID=1188250 RepID=A0A2T4J914_FUSBL|nr:acetoin utilization protein AcuC [Fuscovulum blasticum]PTE14317.1 acetoin utilization protein AcuC [Fuscovulum blasticum DSM 2131]